MNKSRFYTDMFLDQMRREGDTAADEVVKEVFSTGSATQMHQLMAHLDKNNQKLPAELPIIVRDFFQNQAVLPTWADPDKMRRGADFFKKHQEAILTLLGFLSLPYCYAAADGAQVLYLSEQIRSNTLRRLTETAQFVLQVMDTEAFAPEGAGFVSTLKVRLMHATVRYHILKSKHWDTSWGLPINQEDMGGTNGAFSWMSVRGLRKMGYFPEPKAVEDFYHLWSVIGALMGVREELLPNTTQEIYTLDRKIAQRHFRKSEAGVKLTGALLKVFYENKEQNFPKGFPESYMRFLLGDRIADMLGIPPSNWTRSLLSPLRYLNNLNGFLGIKPSDKLQDDITRKISEEKADFQIPLKLP